MDPTWPPSEWVSAPDLRSHNRIRGSSAAPLKDNSINHATKSKKDLLATRQWEAIGDMAWQ